MIIGAVLTKDWRYGVGGKKYVPFFRLLKMVIISAANTLAAKTAVRMTVGRTAELNSEVTTGEVIVYGKVTGNLRARDRVEIKKDGWVVGDIITARVSIEDGADFKSHIEIDRPELQTDADSESIGVPVPTETI